MGFLAMLTVPQHERYKDRNPAVLEFDGDIQGMYKLAREHYPDGKFVIYQVADTGSMKPTFGSNDYAIGIKVPYEELQVGDVVTYNPDWNKGQGVVHRLVQKDKGGWIVSGDNNKRSESWERMTPEKYTSKVMKIIRKPQKK